LWPNNKKVQQYNAEIILGLTAKKAVVLFTAIFFTSPKGESKKDVFTLSAAEGLQSLRQLSTKNNFN
jgi:hypothetical protein